MFVLYNSIMAKELELQSKPGRPRTNPTTVAAGELLKVNPWMRKLPTPILRKIAELKVQLEKAA